MPLEWELKPDRASILRPVRIFQVRLTRVYARVFFKLICGVLEVRVRAAKDGRKPSLHLKYNYLYYASASSMAR